MIGQGAQQSPINKYQGCKMVSDYLESKGNNHHIAFLVDEMGQYIGKIRSNAQPSDYNRRFGYILSRKLGYCNEPANIDYAEVKGRTFQKSRAL